MPAKKTARKSTPAAKAKQRKQRQPASEESAPKVDRADSKTLQVVGLLQRPDGASLYNFRLMRVNRREI
ncbi:MAG: hypothetical protein ABI824_06680 [Acidobacteriota bacterium]